MKIKTKNEAKKKNAYLRADLDEQLSGILTCPDTKLCKGCKSVLKDAIANLNESKKRTLENLKSPIN